MCPQTAFLPSHRFADDTMLRAVVFDLDDTLYPEKDFVVGGLLKAGEELERIIGKEVGAGAIFLEVLENEGVSKIFDKGLARLGVDQTPEILERLVYAYRNHQPKITPFPRVPELLEELHHKGLRLALLTDGPVECQRAKIKALEIASFFDHIVLTHELGGRAFYKPCMAGFETVEILLGVQGQEILMVGDRPDADLEPASKRGWKTIRVAYPGRFHATNEDVDEVRPVARSVDELRKLILALVEEKDPQGFPSTSH